MRIAGLGVLTLAGITLLAASPAQAQGNRMGFFVTSRGLGNGANLGGLEGADAHCQALAKAAGAGNRTWRAYLSTQGPNAVNAKDRIGLGPWYNAKGVMIAANIQWLLHDSVNINHETALDEKGQPVPYARTSEDGTVLPADKQPGPIEHDILTGTQADGTAFAAGEDRTCRNWTSNSVGGAMVGHHDRRSMTPGLSPWSSAHPSKGCSQQNLQASGGGGRLYCFAAD